MMVFIGQARGRSGRDAGQELYATVVGLPKGRGGRRGRRLAGAWPGSRCGKSASARPRSGWTRCQLAQPVIFMIEVALTELLRSWGVLLARVRGRAQRG